MMSRLSSKGGGRPTRMKTHILTKFKHKKKMRCGSRRNIETLSELVGMRFRRLNPTQY